MASATVVPAAPAAAPAAPSSPAPAAPAAPAPVVPAAPASTPESTSTSTIPPVEGTPSSPATPVAPSSDAGTPAPVASPAPAEPKASDYDDAGAFLTAHSRWEKEKADWDEKNPAPAAGDKPEAKTEEPGKDETKPEATTKPDDTPVLTPQEFDKLINDNEALKAAYDADPAAKGAVMKMAREYAKAKPIADMFPTKQSAEFAKQTSVEYVNLRGQFEAAAEDPAQIGTAFESFVDQFKIVGQDGKVVVDDKGQPVLAEDFNLLATHMSKLHAEGAVAELEERLQANQYANEAAREKDEQKLLAWKFITDESEETPAAAAKPDYSALPEEARKAAEAKDARIKELEDKLNETNGTKDTATKTAVKEKWNRDFGNEHAKSLVESTQSLVSELRAEGMNIPQWSLNLRAPGSEVPVFYQNILKAFRDTIQADAYTLKKAKSFERLAPTPENLKERLNFFGDLAKGSLRSIVVAQVREMNKGMEAAAPAAVEEPNPSIEPRSGGGPVSPKPLTMEAARDQAKAELAKEIKGWDEMDPSERNGLVLTRLNRLMSR